MARSSSVLPGTGETGDQKTELCTPPEEEGVVRPLRDDAKLLALNSEYFWKRVTLL